MSKLDWVLKFLTPFLVLASSLLREKDDNSTGADDEAAEAIDFLLKRLEAYRKPVPPVLP